MKRLILIESPNKIPTFQSALKGTEYEDTLIDASKGHIIELMRSHFCNTGIDVEKDFEPHYKVTAKKKSLVQELKDKVKSVDEIIIMSDGDREGEVIAWSLKKFLSIPESKIKRVTTQEITQPAILKALKEPRKIDSNLVDAGIARATEDILIGFPLSGVVRKVLTNLEEEINCPSFGRCQAPGVKIIVDREREILGFKPVKFYELILNFKKNKHDYTAKCFAVGDKKIDDKVNDKDFMEGVDSKCSDEDFVIEKVTERESVSETKKPFITSTFQQEAASKLGLSVASAQKCAQTLFEGIQVGHEHVALITYLRTDSVDISPDFVPILESYVKKTYGTEYFNNVKKYKDKENAQSGHECLRITDPEMTPEKLKAYIEDERLLKVYTLIYNRTIQLAMKASKSKETTYVINNNDVKFSFVSKEVIFDGYRKVYTYDNKNEKLEDTFEKGEVLKDTKLDLVEKDTKPRGRFSEASFIKELEKSGIGRPSTFDKIPTTIIDRGYVEKKEGKLHPTKSGMALIEYAEKNLSKYVDLKYTAQMEQELDDIATGKKTKTEVLTAFFKELKETVDRLAPSTTSTYSKPKAESLDRKCPQCGKPLVKRFSKKTGKFFIGCSGWKPKNAGCNYIENIESDKK